jgi:hypothetical protein
MSKVINMKGEPMPETTQPDPKTQIRDAWNQLFDALVILKEASQQPGFVHRGFEDAQGRTWAPNALLRQANRDFNFVRERIEREKHTPLPR